MTTGHDKPVPSLPMARALDVRYARASDFSYSCHACCRCCHDKIIHVNPYEVARLAKNQGITTTEFLGRYTDAGGTALKQDDAGACVFLTAQGCGVHPDRPLVCRLYPLGRRVSAEGKETFRELVPHPQTEGEYGSNGTIAEFLTRQGAAPFIDAVDRYVGLAGKLSDAIREIASNDSDLHPAINHIVEGFSTRVDQSIPDWLDMDRVLARYCEQRHMTVPEDADGKMAMHIQAVEEWLDK